MGYSSESVVQASRMGGLSLNKHGCKTKSNGGTPLIGRLCMGFSTCEFSILDLDTSWLWNGDIVG